MSQPAPPPSLTCVQCSAPLGVGDRRCPFCGADAPAPLSVRPARLSAPPVFEAATIGLTAHNEAQRSGSMRPLQIVTPRRQPPSPLALLGGVIVVGLLGAGGWGVAQALRPPPAPPPPATRLPPLPAVVSSIGALAVPDADRADPTEVLAQVQRAVAPGDADAQLVSIAVVGSRKGTVDLRTPGPSVTYLYAVGRAASATLVPRGQPLAGREGRQLVLQANGGKPEPATLARGATAVPEPLCVWSAAWRSAVKSGVPEDAVVDGVYASRNGEPRWALTVAGKPEYSRELDGKSCAIKVR